LYPSGAKKLWSESLSGVVDETGDEPVHATADEAVGVAAFEPIPDPTALDHGMTVVAEVLNGIAEETAMRAYLLMRLRAATGSWAVAIFGSSAIFAAYHSHYDAFGISCVFVFGLLFTASWLATKNLWVVALAHALCNLWLEYA
jgi:membrane protease YdiL (CAAX protease family)